MIDFTNIDHFSWKYFFYNAYLRFNHNCVYYKEYRVVNKENIPPKGVPTFVIANHQNGLTDALVLLYMYHDSRQPVFIARGDVFKNQTVAKLLRFVKILPTFRDRDGSRGDVRSNANTFTIAANVLNRGNTVTMFPEAAHQHGNYMGGFKKGFPRIAFEAEELANFQLNLQILPVNIYYDDYYNIRSRVLVTVGKPFQMNDFFELYKTEPNQAYLEFNEYAHSKVKEITLDEGPIYYREYDQIREMLRKERMLAKGKNPKKLEEQRLEDMEIVKDLDQMAEENPTQFKQLIQNTRIYRRGLAKLNLRDWLLNKKVTLFSLMMRSLLFIIAFPFYLFGLINNGLLFAFSAFLKKKIKDRQLHSSMNFAPNVVILLPILYIILFALAWVISGKFWIAILYIVAAFFSLFLFYAYKKGFLKFRGLCRYYCLTKKHNYLLQKLIRLKQEIRIDGTRHE